VPLFVWPRCVSGLLLLARDKGHLLHHLGLLLQDRVGQICTTDGRWCSVGRCCVLLFEEEQLRLRKIGQQSDQMSEQQVFPSELPRHCLGCTLGQLLACLSLDTETPKGGVLFELFVQFVPFVQLV